jgi:serine/threonine-protein kinase SRPK3
MKNTSILTCSRWSWQSNRYVALKALARGRPENVDWTKELEVSRVVSKTWSLHPGRKVVRTVVDSFNAVGPDGNHLCLIYEPMEESLYDFVERIGRPISPALVKSLLYYLLTALDYLHTECKIIHTDNLISR